ncbi:MAG: hypothetical protein OJF55_002642 [Rhodanobacteraceae bacterium]|jgi:hypothetical protein|nr:MAG: hypothetical protein OJF55_002642 [Rhodanobacteraceae bacterium]
MHRVATYIDGFNLYFGLKGAGFKRYYWLDLDALSRQLLRPGQQLAVTHYFTARIRDNGRNTADLKRQNDYLEALATRSVRIQYGHFLEKPRRCLHCRAAWTSYEEKMSDVNLAIQLQADAFDDVFDTALIVSGDSDMTTPIRRIRARFPGKRLIVAFPPKRHSAELQRAAHGFLYIGEDKLRASQLPATITKPDGFVLSRPVTWK